MRIPPYIRSHELRERMSERPSRPFFVSPRDYTIVDGDTISVNLPDPEGKGRLQAFRIRFDSIDTPEMPKIGPNDRILLDMGIDPHAGSPGRAAARLLRDLCRGRAILVEPVIQDDGRIVDKYDRLIANVSISGAPGDLFQLEGAFSASASLYQAGLAYVMEGRTLPPMKPDTVRALLDNQAGGIENIMPMP